MNTQTIHHFTYDEVLHLAIDRGFEPGDVEPFAERAFDRGDFIVVYENVDLSSPNVGALQIMSYGSDSAQIERSQYEVPPVVCPTVLAGMGHHWQYVLQGICFGRTPQEIVMHAPVYTEVVYTLYDTPRHSMIRDLPTWFTKVQKRRMTNLDLGVEVFVEPDSEWVVPDFAITKMPDRF